MRNAPPSAVGVTSNVHVPPKGRLGSAIRPTSLRGGIISTVSIGISPEFVTSMCAGNPFLSGKRFTLFRPWRHEGIASTSVIAVQIASGGWRYRPWRVATWSLGRSHPIRTIKIRNPARVTKIQRIHFMLHLAIQNHSCSARRAGGRPPSSFVCSVPPFVHSRRAPPAPHPEFPLPADRASAAPAKRALAPDRGPTLLRASEH